MSVTDQDIRELPLRDVDPHTVAELTTLLQSRPPTPQLVSAVMDRANVLLQAHGVEAIYDDRRGFNGYWANIAALYVNMGEAYTPTVFYDVVKDKFLVTTWDDWVEGTHT